MSSQPTTPDTEAATVDPVDGLADAAVKLCDEYANATWTHRFELVEQLRSALGDYMRADA